jgi:Tol biopolymer transport system component
MRLVVAVAVVISSAGCPTEPRPDYCNEDTPCESGQQCDYETNTCVAEEDRPDAPGSADARPDAGDSACELAGGRIVFATDRDGDFEIAVMNADGSELQVLTTNTWKDQLPRFSPRGDKIAWLSSVSGFVEAWIMNSDGSDPHNVSDGAVELDAPRWAANDDKLVFVEAASDRPVTVNADGTSRDPLEEAGDTFDADWSPDGTRLVLRQSGAAANDDTVAIVDRDGTDLSTIVPSKNSILGAPRWSPSATQIAFNGSDPVGDGGLWIGTPTGAGNFRVDNPVTRPSWSSNGARIAYRGGGDLFVVPSNGIGPMNLNVTAGTVVGEAEPAWAPDSSRIAFEVELAGASDIFVVDADGGTAVNLTEDPGEDTLGSWAPCP